MKYGMLIIFISAMIFAFGCNSNGSSRSDEDLLSDLDEIVDSDELFDEDMVSDSDVSGDDDSILPDEDAEDVDYDAFESDDMPDVADDDADIPSDDETDEDTVDDDVDQIADSDADEVPNVDSDEVLPDESEYDDDFTDIDYEYDDDSSDADSTYPNPDIDIVFDGDYMTDEDIVADCTDSICNVPAGRFVMGCAALDSDCSSNETPRHFVVLPSYKIMQFEVTVSEYQACIDAGNCNNDAAADPHYAEWSDTVNYEYCNLNSARDLTQPMNCVSWSGAKAYCEWLGMRLPTEAEWEYAARGNDDRIYPWGDDVATCDYAVMKEDGALGCGLGTSWIIGSKTDGDSPFGLSDMAGNLREWCSDWYSSGYYSISPAVDPAGPLNGSYKILRGGSWYRGSVDLRASSRYYSTPLGSLLDSYGFRCVSD